MPRTINIQDKVRVLQEFFAQEKRTPGYKEMLKLFGYRSKNSVYGLLGKLEREGYLVKNDGKIAFTGKLTGSIRLIGEVQAGFPSPAEEELVDTLSLDEFLVDRPEATFMLKVTGNSMIDAGIHADDLVLVERGKQPKSGDVVVAEVDGEWTIKYFFKDSKGVRLEPANKTYSTIRPRNSLNVAGVVKTVIRKYY